MGVLKVWDGSDWRKVGCGSPATPSLVTSGTWQSDVTDAISIPLGGVQPGDLILFVMGSQGVGPAGYTQRWDSNNSDVGGIQVWTRVADGTETSVTATSDLTLFSHALVYVFRGFGFLDVANPQSFINDTSWDTPSYAYAETVPGAVVHIWKAFRNDAVEITPDAALSDLLGTEVGGAYEPGGIQALAAGWETLAGAGATPVRTATTSNGGQAWLGMAVVLRDTTPGRLKLWDGTQWVREACDGDTGGHPLKLWDGTTWQTVACMVFDSEPIDVSNHSWWWEDPLIVEATQPAPVYRTTPDVSALIEADDADGGFIYYDTGWLLGDPWLFTPGATYRFRFYLRATSGTATMEAMHAYIDYTSPGTPIAEDIPFDATTWTLVEGEFTAQGEADVIRVQVTSAVAIYVADWQLERISP